MDWDDGYLNLVYHRVGGCTVIKLVDLHNSSSIRLCWGVGRRENKQKNSICQSVGLIGEIIHGITNLLFGFNQKQDFFFFFFLKKNMVSLIKVNTTESIQIRLRTYVAMFASFLSTQVHVSQTCAVLWHSSCIAQASSTSRLHSGKLLHSWPGRQVTRSNNPLLIT